MVRHALLALALGCLAARPAAQGPAREGSPEEQASAVVLRDALASAGFDLTGIPESELSLRVSDFTVEQSSSRTTVAYSDAARDAPGRAIHVRVRDGAARQARHATLPAAATGAGLVSQVHTTATLTFLDTKVADDTDVMLVLDASLAVSRAVPGHILVVLQDGTVLVRDNTAAFAPARPVRVALYRAGADAPEALHPRDPFSPPRQRFVERVKKAYASWGTKACGQTRHGCDPSVFDGEIVSEVRTDPHDLRLAWVERLGPSESVPDGPIGFRTYVLVTCERVGAKGRCSERAFGGFDGPEGKTTNDVLDSAFRGPVH